MIEQSLQGSLEEVSFEEYDLNAPKNLDINNDLKRIFDESSPAEKNNLAQLAKELLESINKNDK